MTDILACSSIFRSPTGPVESRSQCRIAPDLIIQVLRLCENEKAESLVSIQVDEKVGFAELRYRGVNRVPHGQMNKAREDYKVNGNPSQGQSSGNGVSGGFRSSLPPPPQTPRGEKPVIGR